MVGRYAKSTSLKKLQGNAGKRLPRAQASGDSPSPSSPPENFPAKNFFSTGWELPAWLPDGAKIIWRELLPILRRETKLQQSGLIIFAVYCDALYRLQKFTREIEIEGATYTTKSGHVRKRPEVDMRNSAANAVRSLAIELNLTPKSWIGSMGPFAGRQLDMHWSGGDDPTR